MTNSDVKLNWIKAKNKEYLSVLADVVNPEVLGSRVPRLAEVQEARIAHKNRMETIRELGALADAHMHYVAQIDTSVWGAILDIFARHDPDTGELIDDGLLYKFDPDKGCVVLNKDFFYMLIKMLEDSGYVCDMRGKNKLMV